MLARFPRANSDSRRSCLADLLNRLERHYGLDTSATVHVLLATGYGLRVNELDVATEIGAVEVSLAELHSLVANEEEWFDDLRVVGGEGTFAFGVIDSGSVFAEASDVQEVVQGLNGGVIEKRDFLLGKTAGTFPTTSTKS
ncbi:MAG: hypothetical protein AAGA48_33720 [Myxococcota bacterium]